MIVHQEDLFDAILKDATKAEVKMRSELVNVVKKAILARIEKGEERFTKLSLGTGIGLAARTMLESVFPDQAEAIKNEREEELNRLYATREASIGRMDGKELYTIMGDLRKRVPLKKILNRIPPSEPDECFNVPPVPEIEWVPIGYAPGVMGTTPTPEAMKGSYVVVGD